MYIISLQHLFLSLAWPWPGRSLPKGNQWWWWDPQPGALTWPWWGRSLPKGNQWSVLGPTCHLQCTPYTPNGSKAPWHHTLPCSTWCHLYPGWPKYLHSLQLPNAPLTLLHPWWPQSLLTAPNAPLTPPTPLRTPNALMPLVPLLAPEFLHSLSAPQCTPDSPSNPPNSPLISPHTPYTH